MKMLTRRFWAFLREKNLSSARKVVPLISRLINPKSVLDVGCGDAAWLSVFNELGVHDIQGLDSPESPEDILRIPASNFASFDLSAPVDLGRKFDLTISLEVAEHIPREHAATFIDSLTRHAEAVVFSAAIPGQGGLGHVNEQWPAYWANLFSERGYVALDIIRPAIWNDPDVWWWYRQNVILYATESFIGSHPEIQKAAGPRRKVPLPLVHPDLYALAYGVSLWRLGPLFGNNFFVKLG